MSSSATYSAGNTDLYIDLPDGCDIAGRHIFMYIDAHDDSNLQEDMEAVGFHKLYAPVGSQWFWCRIDGSEGHTGVGDVLHVSIIGATPQVAAVSILLEGVYDEYPTNPGPWVSGGLSFTADPRFMSSAAFLGQPAIALTSLCTDGGAIVAGPSGYTEAGLCVDTDIAVRVDYKLFPAAAYEDPGPYSATGTKRTWSAMVRGTSVIIPPGIGQNLPNEPRWEARYWEALGFPTDWHLEGQQLVMDNSGHDTVFEHGSTYDPDGVLMTEVPAGPYDVPHIARITFTLTGSGTALLTEGCGFIYGWKSAKHEGQRGAAEVGVAIRPTIGFVVIVDGLDYPVPDLGLVSGETYVLEVDFFGGIKVRIAPSVEAMDETLHVYNSLVIAEGVDRSELSLHGWVATSSLIVAIEEIAILMPPAEGDEFQTLFINYGDGATVTFEGFPTKNGTAVWTVDGLPTKPVSVDEVAGTVTFDRPIAWLARVEQSGTKR